jgi:Reverse transcriptase (RNA-dependent DNA polymerase)
MFKNIHVDKWKQFKADLYSSYEFKDLGDLKWFLGIRVIRDRPNRKLWLCQDAYINKIANKFNLTQG